jgi:hypothetical protein
MRVESGFCAGLDLDCPAHVSGSVGGYSRIPQQQALLIRIVRVGFDAPSLRRQIGTFQQLAEQL